MKTYKWHSTLLSAMNLFRDRQTSAGMSGRAVRHAAVLESCAESFILPIGNGEFLFFVSCHVRSLPKERTAARLRAFSTIGLNMLTLFRHQRRCTGLLHIRKIGPDLMLLSFLTRNQEQPSLRYSPCRKNRRVRRVTGPARISHLSMLLPQSSFRSAALLRPRRHETAHRICLSFRQAEYIDMSYTRLSFRWFMQPPAPVNSGDERTHT